MNQSTPAKDTSYPKRALLIINPVSGKKLVLKYVTGIIRTLMNAGYLVTTAVTSHRGEATELAAEFGAEFDLVCCTGGDGTLNETLTGLAQNMTDVPLGYIPCGSTNDFAASHGLSTDILKAAEGIASGKQTRYDIGRFGDHYFNYVAAFGAFSWLSYTTDQNLKNTLGHTAYIIDGIKDAYKIKPIHMKLVCDGRVYEDDYIFGAICNTFNIAGTIELPRDIVKMDDGIFEVILIRMPKTISELNAIIRGILTQDYSCPLIDFFQATALTVDNDPDQEWSLDGECAVVCGDVEFSVVPKFLNLQG